MKSTTYRVPESRCIWWFLGRPYEQIMEQEYTETGVILRFKWVPLPVIAPPRAVSARTPGPARKKEVVRKVTRKGEVK